MMKNLIFLLLASFIFACESGNGQNVNKLEVNEFEKKLVNSSNAQILDVRTPEEFKANHLKNALNADYNGDDFENMIESLDKQKPIFVYCLSGGRSSSAAKILLAKGFVEVYDMKGGMAAWKANNKPYESLIKKQGMSIEDFNKQIATDKLVLVDFNAKWCAPCQKMLPMVTALAETHQDKLTLLKIDFDANEDLVKALKVNEIPLLLIYKKGEIIWQKTGLTEKSELEKVIAEN